jgi:chromosome condensin MukBEF ATPase and DNA-binding subunit MukB
MKINTKKIRVEMERVGMTMEDLGKLLEPPRTRQGASFIVQHGKSFSAVEQLAKVLYLDPKDLII